MTDHSVFGADLHIEPYHRLARRHDIALRPEKRQSIPSRLSVSPHKQENVLGLVGEEVPRMRGAIKNTNFLIIAAAKPGSLPRQRGKAVTLHNSRSLLRLGLAAAVTSLIAGCSAASSSSVASSPLVAPATTSSASPSATALSGPRLAGILLPASSMPNGYKVDPSMTRNTGSQLPSDTAQPIPASQICHTFTQTAYIRAAGIATGDFAQSDYITTDHSQEIAEEIDIFTGTDAQKAMTTLWHEFGKCSSFSYKSNGTTVSSTLKRSRLPGVGDDAIKAVIVAPVFEGGETLVAIRLGSQIITTLDSSSGKDLGSPAVGYAEQIAQRLRAAE